MQWQPPNHKYSVWATCIRKFRWKKGQRAAIIDDNIMDDSQVRETVKQTSGFSGREIGKLMIAMQGAIHSSETGRLSHLRCQEIINTKVEEHNEKVKMKQID